MQLKKHVKIALFSYKELFSMAFLMLFYFNLFQNWGNVFSSCQRAFCLAYYCKLRFSSKIFKRLYFPGKNSKIHKKVRCF